MQSRTWQEPRLRAILIEYLKAKADAEDWHGVSDAANDLRELDAELKGLAMAKSPKGKKGGRGEAGPPITPQALRKAAAFGVGTGIAAAAKAKKRGK